MVPYYGDYPEDHAEIRIPFNTFSSNDPSASVTITDLVDADIEVHADGDTTQIATDGASVIIDFAGETGAHMILIDSSVDAAYTTGTEYAVKVVGTTVDSATINAWVGTFSIERAGGALAVALLIPTTAMRGTDNAALASVLGALNDSANTGDIDTSTTLMAYGKQLLNELSGSVGIGTIPTGLDPANGVNLFEMLRAAMGDTFATATDALDELQADHVALQSDTDNIQTRLPTSLVNSRMDSTIDATGFEAAAVDLIWDEDATAHQTGGTFGQAIGDPGANTETMYDAVVTDAAGTNVAADIIVIEAQTDDIGTAGAGLTNINLPNQTMDITGDITGDLSGSVGSVTAQVTADVTAISGDSTAADRLEALMDGLIVGTINDASATTTAFAADNFTEATDDHFNGRLITFLTGALTGQQTDITDYDAADHAQGAQTFVVTALTEAPGDGVFFIVH